MNNYKFTVAFLSGDGTGVGTGVIASTPFQAMIKAMAKRIGSAQEFMPLSVYNNDTREMWTVGSFSGILTKLI